MENLVMLEKAGTELNNEKAASAIKEYREALEDPYGIGNNYHYRILDVLLYLADKSGIVID